MKRKKTLAVYIAYALALPLGFAGGGVAAYYAFDGDSVSLSPPPAGEWTEPTPIEALVDLHQCWGEAGPPVPNTIPGHAVVSLPGAQVSLEVADVGFEIWLGPDGTPSTGDERPGRLHAFCP